MKQMIEAYKSVWTNWKNFSGRTNRSGYWYAVLVNVIIALVLGFLSGLVDSLSILTVHSGWWYLIAFTGIGSIVLLVWFCQDSQPDNRFGPSPKGYAAPAAPDNSRL